MKAFSNFKSTLHYNCNCYCTQIPLQLVTSRAACQFLSINCSYSATMRHKQNGTYVMTQPFGNSKARNFYMFWYNLWHLGLSTAQQVQQPPSGQYTWRVRPTSGGRNSKTISSDIVCAKVQLQIQCVLKCAGLPSIRALGKCQSMREHTSVRVRLSNWMLAKVNNAVSECIQRFAGKRDTFSDFSMCKGSRVMHARDFVVAKVVFLAVRCRCRRQFTRF